MHLYLADRQELQVQLRIINQKLDQLSRAASHDDGAAEVEGRYRLSHQDKVWAVGMLLLSNLLSVCVTLALTLM